MDPFAQAVSRIIKEQQEIIGPIAIEQAKKVDGLQVINTNDVTISGDKKDVLTKLVNQYAGLFGKASIEICKEAFQPFSSKIPAADVPDVLKTN